MTRRPSRRDINNRVDDLEADGGGALGPDDPLPDDPDDLPLSAGEYYMRGLKHAEGDGYYPRAFERYSALNSPTEDLKWPAESESDDETDSDAEADGDSDDPDSESDDADTDAGGDEQ